MPWVMGAAIVAALAIAALHLLSVRQPPTLWLPTARFVEPGDARAVARRPRPNDLLLLAVRIAALLVAGAALAGARCHAGGPGGVHLVVADSTFRVDSAAWWPAVAAASRPVAADAGNAVQVVWSAGLRTDPGAALVTAQREASRIAALDAAVERIALTVVLPSEVRSTRGWQVWRNTWPGDVRVVRPERSGARDVATGDRTSGRATFAVTVRSPLADDPVMAAFAGVRTERPVVITRDSLNGIGESGESGESGGDTIVVHWPWSGAPRGWQLRTPADSIGGVAAMEVALVAPFVRAYRRDTVGTAADWPILWWADGEAAAVERIVGGGCSRAIYLPVAQGSDQLQGTAATGLRTALTAPCGTALVSTETLGDSGVARPAAADQFRRAGSVSVRSEPWWLTPFLLVVAIALLLVEQVVRRREVAS